MPFNPLKPIKSIFGLNRYKAGGQAEQDPALRRLASTLEQRIRGERPSVAETQLKTALEDNLSNTLSAIRSAPGISQALRTRMISRAGERKGTEFAQAGAELRAAEQAQAEKTLGELLLGGKKTDISSRKLEQESMDEANKRRGKFTRDVFRGASQAMGMFGTQGAPTSGAS